VRMGMGGTMGAVDLGTVGARAAVDSGLTALAARLHRAGYSGRDLSRRCAEADGGGQGLLSESALQSVFVEMGASLSPGDLHAVRGRFQVGGRDGRVDYTALCRSLGGAAAATTSSKKANVGFAGVLASPATSKRVQGLRQEGVVLREAFAEADIDGTHTMDSRRFGDMLLRLGLVQTERQLCLAVDEYACNADRSRVNYMEFLSALEAAEGNRRMSEESPRGTSRLWAPSPAGGDPMSYTPLGRPAVMGSGYDGARSNCSVGSGDGADSMRPPRGDTTGWNDDDSVRTEMDNHSSLGNGMSAGIALGRNIATSASGPAGTWACRVCGHDRNGMDLTTCVVCDSYKSAAQDATLGSAGTGTVRMCGNCKFENFADARACKMCELLL